MREIKASRSRASSKRRHRIEHEETPATDHGGEGALVSGENNPRTVHAVVKPEVTTVLAPSILRPRWQSRGQEEKQAHIQKIE